jgi:hypothetical protein
LQLVSNFRLKELPLDLFDFFFPEQAQASHLRKIAKQRSVSSGPAGGTAQSSELQALRDDVGFLTLVITALLRRLSETETLSLADVQDLLDEIDALDGVADGGLDPGVLRGLLGVLKNENEDQAEADNEEFNIVTTPRYRRT